ncbi:ATP-grasp domain-containing protein [Archaeoglobus veneficus]|uniref:ATP-grasp fold domain protein, DUF201-type n=1 Tax=Archaeoglobus veneficus (strain DSM 11195 / SNP6) TaxID=693661 RepID=F2KRL6_ARCVS|nr:ATP-grasp domain-containing protein [Archaeoglobus veneficus]AEA46781.1 ATP-grasp fold domain protein, DUF201-type [Archaeoglobus veneficus SNP6]
MNRVVVAGINVRNVAESARKAGWTVFAVTKYCDADLYLYADRIVRVEDKQEAEEAVKEVSERYNAPVVLSTGFEDLKVENTIGRVDERTLDKRKFYRILERAGIPHPEFAESCGEGPFLVKPRRGGGGVDVFLSDTPVTSNDCVCQQYIQGTSCSVSLLCGRRTTVVAVNHLLSGWNEMNASDFKYSGNITPYPCEAELRNEICRIAVETVELFDLSGSVGVDFIIADKPYVLEVNPRFQGSLDSIEWSLDVNLFSMHVASVEGRAVEVPKPRRFAARTIMYADREMRLKIPATCPFFADIPPRGVKVEKGEPLLSILASGGSFENVVEKVLERKNLVYAMQL